MPRSLTIQDAYEETTRQIKVRAMPSYLDDQSAPEDSYYFWSYTIEIENHGDEPVQLRTRYWRITDANGQVQEVRGEGVVGEEPLISPGESYSYTSGAPLQTPSGIMERAYQMQDRDGAFFDVKVPAFSLDSPFSDQSYH